MLFTEMYDMCRFVQGFLDVPDQEFFGLVNSEEFTKSSSEFDIGKLCDTIGLLLITFFWCYRETCLIILEIKITPSNLSNWVLTSMIPYSDW